MSTADEPRPVSAEEAVTLFAGLERACGAVLAVSGGPDSTALLLLASRWRRSLAHGPALIAVTVDHALRAESRSEAEAVKRVARQCGVAHRIVHWSDRKPSTGLQRAARAARYRLLAEVAARFGADHILTAHTRDDQAETLLMRMSRGSGVTGLCGMARVAPVPEMQAPGIVLLRPLLDIAKARLIATVEAAGVPFADDPSNRDPRFTRARLRQLMPGLAREGLDSARLAQFARRLRRVELAIEAAVDSAWAALVRPCEGNALAFGRDYVRLPDEVQLRLLGRAVAQVGCEGVVELAKLEALHAALSRRVRRTLAGAIVTSDDSGLRIEPAPPRRARIPYHDDLNQGTTLPPHSS